MTGLASKPTDRSPAETPVESPVETPDPADVSTQGSGVKVSVIVPVYNPGPYLEDCINSLLRQSLPSTEFEAIFVDDGSTDDSPARLDALSAAHPHLRVIHQQNSGWSGKPRNVGIAHARGEYVFFVDNDDWLGDEALERMYAFAKENGSDVVVGKMAGKGRGVPRELFRKTYPHATLSDAPLIDSLTPHKMFRKEFLDEHGLRFPEGRRRLEDHVFVTAAYFAARTVSVLSDYVCYYHVRRDDASNAGFQRLEHKGYFANLREALDIVEANTEPGPLRDRLYRRWFRQEMLERLRGRRLLHAPDEDRRALLEEVRLVCSERFGPGVAAGLPAAQRIIGSLAMAGRLDALVQLAEWEERIRTHARLDDLGWHGGALRLAVTAELRANSAPMTFTHRGDRDLLLPPLPAEALQGLAEDDLDTTDRLPHARLDVILRARGNAAEFFVPVAYSGVRKAVDESATAAAAGPSSGELDEQFRLILQGEAEIDVSTVAGSGALASGVWDVTVRLSGFGWTKDTRLGAVRATKATENCVPAILGEPPRIITPHWTNHANLSLDVGDHAITPGLELIRKTRPVVAGTPPEATLTIPLRAVVAEPRSGAAIRLVHDGSGKVAELNAELAPAVTDGTAHSELCAPLIERLDPGRYSVAVRLFRPGASTASRGTKKKKAKNRVADADGFISLPATLTVPTRSRPPVVDVLTQSGPDETFDATAAAPPPVRDRLARRGRRLARRIRRRLVRQPVRQR
ncbi:glycosyltransferase family 2 protein [Actinopolymorpha sp. B9G3]|uniref:glycosyltransferase family 2 protein n=1 Tax=Actinopolymorpha sp. B9G3 TaxID=3158970 RepID=UPI0032D92F50